MMRLLTTPRQLATHFGRRSNSTIAGTIYYRCNYHDPERVALISPSEDIKWTYGELWSQVMVVAGALKNSGFSAGDIVATDLDYTSQSLLFQFAIAHEGMQLLTVKDAAQYNSLAPRIGVAGAVSNSLPGGISFSDVKNAGGKASEGATDRNYDLGYYRSGNIAGNRQVYLHGVGLAGLLAVKPCETVCVAASHQSVFGMGCVLSAIVRSGIIYLPPVDSPDLGGADVVVADEAGAEALKGKTDSSVKRGLVKVGKYNESTGIPLINGSQEFAGTRVYTLGAEGKHPLFDACSDTYIPMEFF
jgi:hypothetical protein